MSTYSSYKKDLIHRFWGYQKERYPEWKEYLDLPYNPNGRPPVFTKRCADHNVLIDPASSPEMGKQLLDMISVRERHRWFRSMTSSQAIALSIFGNLKVGNGLHYIQDLQDDGGVPLFDKVNLSDNFHMEYSVTSLGEPRPTSLDGFVSEDYQIAIECKLTEPEVGTCSRPRLIKKHSNYETDFCNGSYTFQNGRGSRCSLTEKDILYWKYVPKLFSWNEDIDHNPCPLRKNYQLVRNILAACVRANGQLRPENGHAVLIYDERNPAFSEGGEGYKSFVAMKDALYNPALLRKCSWQHIIGHIRSINKFPWLSNELKLKYGI